MCFWGGERQGEGSRECLAFFLFCCCVSEAVTDLRLLINTMNATPRRRCGRPHTRRARTSPLSLFFLGRDRRMVGYVAGMLTDATTLFFVHACPRSKKKPTSIIRSLRSSLPPNPVPSSFFVVAKTSVQTLLDLQIVVRMYAPSNWDGLLQFWFLLVVPASGILDCQNRPALHRKTYLCCFLPLDLCRSTKTTSHAAPNSRSPCTPGGRARPT